jgi:ABC-type amino acid transport substrate-binding protein
MELNAVEMAKLTEEMQAIHSRGVLQVAMYARDRFPFFYVDEAGVLSGSEVILAKDIAEKFGVKVNYVRTAQSFEELVDQVASGQADVAISKLSMTLGRAQKVLFSSPYLTLRQSLLINRLQLARLDQMEGDPLKLIQVSGGIVGAVSGSSYVKFAQELFPKSEIKLFESGTELIASVSRGEVLAALYDEFEISMHLKRNPGSSLDLQFIPLNDKLDPLAIAVSVKQPHLYAWINVYLDLNHSFIQQILKHYEIIK